MSDKKKHLAEAMLEGVGKELAAPRRYDASWNELQRWLMMNVGSKEADECLSIASRIVEDINDGRRQCSTCVAWKLKTNQSAPVFGGCARSGKTTLHYGDVAYNHYTTDLQSCSAWEAK